MVYPGANDIVKLRLFFILYFKGGGSCNSGLWQVMVNLGRGIKNFITCCRALGDFVFCYGVAAKALLLKAYLTLSIKMVSLLNVLILAL